jgi:protein arginine kinase activator
MAILCQICKQAPATVHLTDIRASGEAVERHMCDNCATDEGVTMKPHEPVNAMLEKFVKIGANIQQAAQRKCPKCGISFGEFRAQGVLGCPHDYKAFGELLAPLIERAHGGASEHVGKTPGAPTHAGTRAMKARTVRRQLDAAIKNERYEEAARLRDELNQLDKEAADER